MKRSPAGVVADRVLGGKVQVSLAVTFEARVVEAELRHFLLRRVLAFDWRRARAPSPSALTCEAGASAEILGGDVEEEGALRCVPIALPKGCKYELPSDLRGE